MQISGEVLCLWRNRVSQREIRDPYFGWNFLILNSPDFLEFISISVFPCNMKLRETKRSRAQRCDGPARPPKCAGLDQNREKREVCAGGHVRAGPIEKSERYVSGYWVFCFALEPVLLLLCWVWIDSGSLSGLCGVSCLILYVLCFSFFYSINKNSDKAITILSKNVQNFAIWVEGWLYVDLALHYAERYNTQKAINISDFF